MEVISRLKNIFYKADTGEKLVDPKIKDNFAAEIETKIAENIQWLLIENNEFDAAIGIGMYITLQTKLPLSLVAHILDGNIHTYSPINVLAVIKYAAEYFNITTDYILGLTDKAY